MPVYHIGLFKLKHDADQQKVQKWQQSARQMVGQVPGLIDLRADFPIELTAPMAKGYDMGVVVLMDYVESLATFFTHPSHERVNELYQEVCEKDSTLAYDIEF